MKILLGYEPEEVLKQKPLIKFDLLTGPDHQDGI